MQKCSVLFVAQGLFALSFVRASIVDEITEDQINAISKMLDMN